MIEGISNKSLNTACVDGGLLYKVTFTQIDNEDNAFTVIYVASDGAEVGGSAQAMWFSC